MKILTIEEYRRRSKERNTLEGEIARDADSVILPSVRMFRKINALDKALDQWERKHKEATP